MYFYKDFKHYLKAYHESTYKNLDSKKEKDFKKTLKALPPEEWIKLGDKYARHCLKEIHGI